MREPDNDTLKNWQEALDYFERFFWPLFQARGFSKEATYLYWTLHRLEQTLEELPFIFADVVDHRPPDDEDDAWKR